MKKLLGKQLIAFFILLSLSSCSDDKKTEGEAFSNPTILSADGRFNHSTEIGNFVTTAIRRAHNLDFVFLPTGYIPKNAIIRVKPDMVKSEVEEILRYFPDGPRDQLLFGTMRGDRVKDFILQRTRETYNAEMEVAGIWYSATYQGGFLTASNFLMDGRYQIDDDEYYRIAITDDFYFGSAFPGYKYRNGFNFNFRREKQQFSIRKSILKYLDMKIRYPYWSQRRAVVNKIPAPNVGYKEINEIQGISHTSPYFGKTVTTKGIVTAFGTADWYPFGNDVYIQTKESDDDPRTSEAVHVFIESSNAYFELGDEIEVTGVVYEDIRKNGMGQTSIRDVSSFKTLSDPNIPRLEKRKNLPEPAFLGEGGRQIPTDRISTYGGQLMRKESLNLRDGIDFWESLEGMRIEMQDLRVLGFRGGKEDLIEISDRFYLNLYVASRGQHSVGAETYRDGLMIDFKKEDFNPEVTLITTNHLTNFDGLVPKKGNASFVFNVGDKLSARVKDPETGENVLKNKVRGVLTYQKNVFGGGEYAIVLPEVQDSISKRSHRREITPVIERGITELESHNGNEVTVTTFNLENLAGHQLDRIKVMGESIAYNLKCPDVVNLVEIQDNNGFSFRDTQDATGTLKKLRGVVQSLCLHRDYQFVDIDPFLNAEGGQPGGNIRVAMMYDASKLFYEERSDNSIGKQAIVGTNGVLSTNPGRIFPNHEAFRRSRRSVVTEFGLVANPSEKLYVIGNHLNSKLGDIDFWGNNQPARANSDFRRARMAAKINEFIRWIEQENPEASIVVLGDFNALAEEGSLSVLSNKEETLRNMIFTLPKDRRYTTNHNGNSQPLDYIFVNNRLFNMGAEAEIMHINSDFMGRLSDHDPVMLKVYFPKLPVENISPVDEKRSSLSPVSEKIASLKAVDEERPVLKSVVREVELKE